MDLARYCVNAVLVEHRSHREVAACLGRSKSWVGNQVKRYEAGGEAGLVLGKRGPKHSPRRTTPELEDAIVTIRKDLSEEGYDAGARTISYHLANEGLRPPGIATIHRVLVRRGFVSAQPQKRPRNSFIRFEADLPNECWQSDMTHWKLRGDHHVEIINFIDDHSRAVMASVVVPVAKVQDVVDVFYQAVERYGFPTSVLTDIQTVRSTPPNTVDHIPGSRSIWPGLASS